MGRYRRLVPFTVRRLIRQHRLPRPNWYVGSAEAGHLDRETQEAVDRVKARLAAYRACASDEDA